MDIIPTPLAPYRPRRNGWTAERQAVFIRALGETASVSAAAARAGMSRQAAHWLRRQPAAADFRAAWDAALVEAWTQVEATALERVLNGETETFERDGVSITRHRPCAPRLLVHMVDRAIAAREKAETAVQAKQQKVDLTKIRQVREDIRALAGIDDDDGCYNGGDRYGAAGVAGEARNQAAAPVAAALAPPPAPSPLPELATDAPLCAVGRLDALTRGFVDRPGWELGDGGDGAGDDAGNDDSEPAADLGEPKTAECVK